MSTLKVDTIQTAAGGTPTASDLGLNTTGNVLQVVQGQFNGYFTTGSTAFVDVTGFNASITPSSASNKILIMVSASFHNPNTSFTSSEIRVTVNGNTFGGTANDSRMWNSNFNTGNGDQAQVCESKYLYSPSSTAQQTFQVQLRTRNSTTAIGEDWNGDQAGMHTIILMEIAG